MEFFNSFIPVHIKYEFHAENTGPHLARDWIECRLNVKPAPTSYQYVQINVYPKHYDEMTPHFTHDIDYTSIRSGGPVKSRSMENVFGVVWRHEQKKCRIFIALENKTMHQNFNKYFRKLLKYFNLYNNCENEHKVFSKNGNSSVCNEAEQMTASTSQAGASSLQIVRVSNASGSYEDVVLRPKDPEPICRLARSLAALSGLFKSNRETGANQEKPEAKNPISAKESIMCASKTGKKTVKRKNWKIFRSKQKHRDESPTFQHFQEPLNIERMSLGPLAISSDAEWYDLNKDEMSLLEARLSTIVNQFNNYSPIRINSGSDSESIDGNKIRCSLAISSNILWSHNLSMSCQSGDNGSHINLLGANLNPLQMPNDVCIEDGGEILAIETLKASFVGADSNEYAVIQSIHSKKSHEPTTILNDGCTQSSNLHSNHNLNDSSNASSGFGSDSDQNTPQKSIDDDGAANNSPATSDFSEAFPSDQSNGCSPITPLHTRNTMQKASKKLRLQIKSRKLFEKLYVKHNAIEIERDTNTTK